MKSLTMEADFSGTRLLVIEQDYFLDEDTKVLLVNMGVEVFAIDQDEVSGLAAMTGKFDGAVIDVRLPSEVSLSIIETLADHGIAYVFALAERPPEKHTRFHGFYLWADRGELRTILKALFADDQMN